MKSRVAPLVVLTIVCFQSLSYTRAADDAVAQSSPGKQVTAVGTVEPEEVIDVGAQVCGTVVSFGPDPTSDSKTITYGSQVEVGAVLAQLEKASYAIQLEIQQASCRRAEAELKMAKAELEQAERAFAREKRLGSNSRAAFEQEESKYEKAAATAAMAEAALAENKAKLKLAELNLANTTIRSPIKGTIIDRRVNVGQVVVGVQNSSSLFLIADIEKLQVWAAVPERAVARVHRGQHVHFTLDAYPNKVFEGEVKQTHLNATMLNNMVTYTVAIAFSNAERKVLPYMTANVEFEP